MPRLLPVLLLLLCLAPGTWLRERPVPGDPELRLQVTPVPLPAAHLLRRNLGAFELQGVWRLSSRYSGFGGYSALLARPGGRLLAITDNAEWLAFSPPGTRQAPPAAGQVLHAERKRDRDIEAATQDPATGTIWTAREDSNAISRHDPGLRALRTAHPPELRGWRHNSGAEAMARLPDGRFIVLDEGTTGFLQTRLHRGVLFAGDPLAGHRTVRFAFAGTRFYAPTDMAALPDGRVLILERRLVWFLPLRFVCRLLLADPQDIRAGQTWQGTIVARLTDDLPVDNFEAMAITLGAGGKAVVWLMSDDNHAATQRTLLWKLAIDPADLPRASRTREKARK